MNNLGANYVWPGLLIDVEPGKLTLTLVQMDGETPEQYNERCGAIADCALSKCPRPEPPTIDFSDTTKYKQVGPSSWEALTPGYAPEQEIE